MQDALRHHEAVPYRGTKNAALLYEHHAMMKEILRKIMGDAIA